MQLLTLNNCWFLFKATPFFKICVSLLFIGEGHEKCRNSLKSTISIQQIVIESNDSNEFGFLSSVIIEFNDFNP